MDAYKDLLVVLDTAPTCASRIDLASGLAGRFGAHLTGLYISPPPQIVVPAMVESQFAPELMEIQTRSLDEARGRVQELFRQRADMPGFTSEWRAPDGEVGEVASLHARYADLTVVGQVDPEAPDALGAASDLPERIVLGAGRPVLVVPYAGTFKTLGQRVLVAWNGSREATRAVGDALPLLVGASKVTVLIVNPRGGRRGHGEVPGADIALHLARHGVRAEAATVKSDDVEVGAFLLSYAADLGADLLVMGAYGHSRLREVVLGGATREILRTMTIPVLVSH
jgi:nucleotide-binding universal stress UspA family protein